MELFLKRYDEQYLRTFGKLHIDGVEICDTLEDTDRHLEDHLMEIPEYKMYGKTAIPRGEYDVENYWWSKHRNWYPWVQNVPGFTGILIHGGSTEDHTLGCILVGTRKGDILVNCGEAMSKIRDAFKIYKHGKIQIR